MPFTNTTPGAAIDISNLLNNTQAYLAEIPAADLVSGGSFWWVANLTTPRQVSLWSLGTPVSVVRVLPQAVITPACSTWSGTPSALVAYPAVSSLTDISTPINAPFLTLPFTVYLQVKVVVLSGTVIVDPLRVTITPSPAFAGPAGSILITNFNEEWPAAVIGTDGQFKQSAYIASSDFGAILDDGTIAVIDNQSSPPHVKIYSPSGALLFDKTGLTTALTFQQIQGDGTTNFYVAGSALGSAAVVKTVSKAGVVGGTTWTLPANSKGIEGMAPNRAGSILYYQSFQGGAPTSEVFKYDLVGMAPLASLAAALAGYAPVKDLFVTQAGDILVGYNGGSVVIDKIVRYNPAGTVQATYSLPSLSFRLDRFALGTDDPNSFWVYAFVGGSLNGTANFLHYRMADGAILGDSIYGVPLYTDGDLTAPAVNNPPRFGVSNSCPLLIIRAAFPAPPGGPTGTTQAGFTTDPQILRRLRRAPWLSQEQMVLFFKRLRIDMEAGRGLGGVAATVQGYDPLFMIRWSDDGGHTWSSEIRVRAGKVGQYKLLIERLTMGSARQRAYELVVSDPTAWNIVGAYMEIGPGRS